MSHSTESYSTLPLGPTEHVMCDPTTTNRLVYFLCGKSTDRLRLEDVGPTSNPGKHWYRRTPKLILQTPLDSPHLCRSCAHALMMRKRLRKPGWWALEVSP